MIQGHQPSRQLGAPLHNQVEVDGEYERPQEGHHGRSGRYVALDLANGREQVVAAFLRRRGAEVPVAGVVEVVGRPHDVTECGNEVGDGEEGDDGAGARAHGGPPRVHVDDQGAAEARQQAGHYGHDADVPAHGRVCRVRAIITRDLVSWTHNLFFSFFRVRDLFNGCM